MSILVRHRVAPFKIIFEFYHKKLLTADIGRFYNIEKEENYMSEYKTIGQVSELTGIPKRTLKYYIEQKIVTLSQKDESGRWLYCKSDIEKIKQIALFRELDYSADKIKKLLSDPQFDWQNELDKQIPVIREKKNHLESILFAAEVMRHISDTEQQRANFDISFFGNNIDAMTNTIRSNFFLPESLSEFEESMTAKDDIAKREKAQTILDAFSNIKKHWDDGPNSPIVQEDIKNICTNIFIQMQPSEMLFLCRLLRNLSGIHLVIDVILGKNGGIEFIEEALQIYCDSVSIEE